MAHFIRFAGEGEVVVVVVVYRNGDDDDEEGDSINHFGLIVRVRMIIDESRGGAERMAWQRRCRG